MSSDTMSAVPSMATSQSQTSPLDTSSVALQETPRDSRSLECWSTVSTSPPSTTQPRLFLTPTHSAGSVFNNQTGGDHDPMWNSSSAVPCNPEPHLRATVQAWRAAGLPDSSPHPLRLPRPPRPPCPPRQLRLQRSPRLSHNYPSPTDNSGSAESQKRSRESPPDTIYTMVPTVHAEIIPLRNSTVSAISPSVGDDASRATVHLEIIALQNPTVSAIPLSV